ncbi:MULTISPECIES: CPBP family intramembrane glutamic endopeptidase [Chloracidobacterium]|uniref:CPBP family intramembrane glutamic endopeptidase n=1 Tax=Chloracidobacterium TaxID=458032 RepID=UPI0002FBCA1C|nr:MULTISPECIES: CPBP family intramembrane glutamic endopeptidase [Chloracidobacterium]QUV85296.1 CPBP family intramembrane metalloprotease [Chloracidobacterium sp. 2]QUV91222.1 CPBP family intramembrane metalloprotease [Chloracidobacterium sp. A]
MFRRWVATRPVACFFGLTVLLSWSYWLTLLASGQQVRPGSSATHLPGLLGPLVAAVIITWLAFGQAALLAFIKSALVLPHPRFQNALLASSPLLIAGVTFLGLAAAGGELPSRQAFCAYPGAPADTPLLILLPAVLLLNGYGEEAGWRGFATRHLAPKLGRFRATLVVASVWAVWHAPLFWLNASMQALVGPVLLGWGFGLLCAAFLLAGLYFLSQESVLVVAVWHTLYNFTVATPAGTGTPAALITTVVIVWGAWFAFVWSREPNSSNA